MTATTLISPLKKEEKRSAPVRINATIPVLLRIGAAARCPASQPWSDFFVSAVLIPIAEFLGTFPETAFPGRVKHKTLTITRPTEAIRAATTCILFLSSSHPTYLASIAENNDAAVGEPKFLTSFPSEMTTALSACAAISRS